MGKIVTKISNNEIQVESEEVVKKVRFYDLKYLREQRKALKEVKQQEIARYDAEIAELDDLINQAVALKLEE